MSFIVWHLLAFFCLLNPLVSSLLSIDFSPNVTVPAAPGSYVSTLCVETLIDSSRKDPFNQTDGPRKLLLSRFDPILKQECSKLCSAPYMPRKTAAFEDENYSLPTAFFGRFHLSGLCCDHSSYSDHHDAPLLVFSTGMGNSRLVYSALAQYVSSFGYSVVTIDHTYDSGIVEFPDGSTVIGLYNNDSAITEEDVEFSLEVRVKDVQSVLEELADYSSDGGRIGLFGHSLGGATVGEVMRQDSSGKLTGGINLDGSLLDPLDTKGLGKGWKGFLMMASEGHNGTIDPSWAEFWNATNIHNPKDPRWELLLEGAAHSTYTDIPLLAYLTDYQAVDADIVSTVGTIDGQRTMDIVVAYCTALFDYTIQGKMESLLNSPSEKYPEVEYVHVEGS